MVIERDWDTAMEDADEESKEEMLQALFEEATQCKADGDYQGAIEKYTQVLEAEPDYKEACYNLANAYRHVNQMDLAIQFWTKALKIDKDFIGAHINLGIAMRANGNLEEAIFHYLQVVEIDDQCTEAYVNLGVAHAARGARGDARKAADYYNKAISQNADCLVAHYNLALHQKSEGQLEAALSSFEKVIALGGTDPVVHCHTGSLLLDIHHQRAKKLWGTVQKFTTGDTEKAAAMLTQEALALKQEDELRAQRLETAMERFDCALKLDPHLMQASVGKGLVYIEQLRTDDALRLFEEVTEQWPNCVAAWHKLAEMYSHSRPDEVKALDAWENVYRLDTSCKEAIDAIGRAYKKMGRIDQALKLYRVANKLDPYYQWWFKASLKDRRKGQSPSPSPGAGAEAPSAAAEPSAE